MSLVNMVLKPALFFGVLTLLCVAAYRLGDISADTQSGGIARKHGVFAKKRLLSFALWTIVATAILAAGLFLGSGWLYEKLGGESFISGDVKFDAQSYIGMLSAILGIPLAITGAFFAIYLAQVSMAIASSQFDLTERQLIHDHPLFVSFANLWVVRAKIDRSVAIIEQSIKDSESRNIADTRNRIVDRTNEIIKQLRSSDTEYALIVTGEIERRKSTINDFYRLVDSIEIESTSGNSSLAVVKKLRELSEYFPDRIAAMEQLRSGVSG